MSGKQFRKNNEVDFWSLFQTGRPVTAGLYSLVLPIVSFGFYSEKVLWSTLLVTAFGFMCLTMSIMTFNDWVDRHHDRQKGKFFASEHPKEIWSYWVVLSAVTCGILLLLGLHDEWLALYCVLVWLAGLLYSFVPHWYIGQNLIVALSCGSPALCAAVYFQRLNTESVLTFLMFAGLLFVNEIHKDIEDAEIDHGYKATLPVRNGHKTTVFISIGLVSVPATVMVLHPNEWVFWIASVGLPLLVLSQASMLQQPEYVARAKKVVEWVVVTTLLVLLLT